MSRAVSLAFALLLLAVIFTTSIAARRWSPRVPSRPSHSQPSSQRHSGSNFHHYPRSGGLSGSGARRSHNYPPSRGFSGSNSHAHRPSGGMHQPRNHARVSNTHAAPSRANGHSYPSSRGLSGNNRGNTGGVSNVHYHQHVYHAPQKIQYTPVRGAAPVHPYPVYHGQPPVYIHEIRDSGSRYSTLLTGLALYNLGRSTSGSHHHHHYQSKNQPPSDNGERCTLRIEQNRNVERVKIPCYIVSTFKDASDISSATSRTTAAPLIKSSISKIKITPSTRMFNGTVTVTHNTSSTAQNVVVRNASNPVDAVKVKGEPLQLNKEARCFVETVTRTRTSVKEIECGLLQQYALQSMRPQQQQQRQQQQQQQHPRSTARRTNSASKIADSAFTLFVLTVLKYIVY